MCLHFRPNPSESPQTILKSSGTPRGTPNVWCLFHSPSICKWIWRLLLWHQGSRALPLVTPFHLPSLLYQSSLLPPPLFSQTPLFPDLHKYKIILSDTNSMQRALWTHTFSHVNRLICWIKTSQMRFSEYDGLMFMQSWPPVDPYYNVSTKAHRFRVAQTEIIFILEIGTCSHLNGLAVWLFCLCSLSVLLLSPVLQWIKLMKGSQRCTVMLARILQMVLTIWCMK